MPRNRVFLFDRYRLNEQERLLLRGTEAIALAPKLFDLLAELVRDPGHLIGKQDLIDRVWADVAVEEGSLTRGISSLRAVLGVDAKGREYIETVPKRGYRFVAEVSEIAGPGAHALQSGRIPPPPWLVPSAIGDFVGRESELHSLHGAWVRANGGHRQLLLIAGEPGIGKTRLSMVFAARCVEQGSTVLVGYSDEENLVPYQPFVQSLGWYVRHCPVPEIRAQLAGIEGAGELAQLIPELRTCIPDLAKPAAVDAEGRRYRLFEAVAALLSSASRARPVLLVLDDLHWADKSTLLLLRHIMRSAHVGAFAIVATYRDTELSSTHPLADLLTTLRREPSVTRVLLRGLDVVGVAALVDSIAGPGIPSDLPVAVMDATNGNPFFATEMVRHLKETGTIARFTGTTGRTIDAASLGLSEGIKEVVGRRLSRLSDACNKVLGVAAIVGREFDAALVEAVADLADEVVLDALEEATRAHLIAESRDVSGRFAFTHALIRESLYSDLSSARRIRLHRRVGEAIEQLAPNLPSAPLAELAFHFSRAASGGTVDKAIDYATRAGERAADGLAHEEAVLLFELALHSLDLRPAAPETDRVRADLHRRRALSFEALGQWTAEVVELQAVLRHVDADQSEARCEILLALARASFLLLDVRPVEQYASEALQLAERLRRSDFAASAIAWQARCRQANGDLATAIEMDRGAIVRAPGVATAAHMIGPLTLYLAGKSPEAIPRAIEAADAAARSGDLTFTMYALTHLGLTMGAVGRYAEASNAFHDVRRFGRKYGALPMLARATAFAAGLHLTVLDFETAEALQAEARELGKSVGFAPSIISTGIDSLLTLARRREPGQAERLLGETTAAIDSTTDWHGWLWRLRLTEARAELALAREAFDVARDTATAGIEQSRTTGRPKYEALGLITRARARHALGRTRDAAGDANAAVSVAEQTADPALLLVALDTLIVIEGSDELVNRAHDAAERIFRALPDEVMRHGFAESEVVRRIRRSSSRPWRSD